MIALLLSNITGQLKRQTFIHVTRLLGHFCWIKYTWLIISGVRGAARPREAEAIRLNGPLYLQAGVGL